MEYLSGAALVASIVAAVVAVLSFRKSRTQDTKKEASAEAVLISEIGYVKANTDEIKNEQKEQRKETAQIREDLVAVRESTKSAHKRIDGLEEHVYGK